MKFILQVLICCTIFGQLYAQQNPFDNYLVKKGGKLVNSPTVEDNDVAMQIERGDFLSIINPPGGIPVVEGYFNKLGALHINLYNMQGQNLHSIHKLETTNGGTQRVKIEKNNLSQGIYFLHAIYISKDGTIVHNWVLKFLI